MLSLDHFRAPDVVRLFDTIYNARGLRSLADGLCGPVCYQWDDQGNPMEPRGAQARLQALANLLSDALYSRADAAQAREEASALERRLAKRRKDREEREAAVRRALAAHRVAPQPPPPRTTAAQQATLDQYGYRPDDIVREWDDRPLAALLRKLGVGPDTRVRVLCATGAPPPSDPHAPWAVVSDDDGEGVRVYYHGAAVAHYAMVARWDEYRAGAVTPDGCAWTWDGGAWRMLRAGEADPTMVAVARDRMMAG